MLAALAFTFLSTTLAADPGYMSFSQLAAQGEVEIKGYAFDVRRYGVWTNVSPDGGSDGFWKAVAHASWATVEVEDEQVLFRSDNPARKERGDEIRKALIEELDKQVHVDSADIDDWALKLERREDSLVSASREGFSEGFNNVLSDYLRGTRVPRWIVQSMVTSASLASIDVGDEPIIWSNLGLEGHARFDSLPERLLTEFAEKSLRRKLTRWSGSRD